MYESLNNKVVIVSGASQGIGLAIAERFNDEGSVVFNLDIKPPESASARATFVKCDVSSVADVKRAVSVVTEAAHRVDVVVNNAGIEEYYSVHETPVAEWDRVLGVNLKGPFLLTKECLPYLLKAENSSVIFIASVQSSVVQKRDAAYVTSKHALLGLARSLAVDYAPRLRSVAICPGTVITPLQIWCAKQEVGEDEDAIQRKLDEWGKMCPMGREADPAEIASVAVFAASDQASYMTGNAIYVDGGLSAYIPESVPEPENGGK